MSSSRHRPSRANRRSSDTRVQRLYTIGLVRMCTDLVGSSTRKRVQDGGPALPTGLAGAGQGCTPWVGVPGTPMHTPRAGTLCPCLRHTPTHTRYLPRTPHNPDCAALFHAMHIRCGCWKFENLLRFRRQCLERLHEPAATQRHRGHLPLQSRHWNDPPCENNMSWSHSQRTNTKGPPSRRVS